MPKHGKQRCIRPFSIDGFAHGDEGLRRKVMSEG